MSKNKRPIIILLLLYLLAGPDAYAERQRIHAIGLPLADHYAGIVAYEKYRQQMQFADYHFKLLASPALVRAYFYSEDDADIAFLLSPMVMEMFAEDPYFRWVSLLHRDGNALAINDVLNARVELPFNREVRRPDDSIAQAIREFKEERGQPLEIGIPSLLATHTVILYKYLKDHGLSFSFNRFDDVDVVLKAVKPSEAPIFLRKNTVRSRPAAFEQSLPWAEVAETRGFGTVGWYSKHVLQHEQGHVECIIVAKNKVIHDKRDALQEVIRYIHMAGRDIEVARRNGGRELDELVEMIQKHIPAHTREAIIQSLRPDLNTINYSNLNIDSSAKTSFRRIMDLALEAGLVRQEIAVYTLADDSFSTDVNYSEAQQ